MMPAEPTGEQLVTRWTNRNHTVLQTCPRCGGNCSTIGIPKIVYSFELCECEAWDYPHLAEQLWHRACFAADAAERAVEDAETAPVEAAFAQLRELLGNTEYARHCLPLVELVARTHAKVLRSRTHREERLELVAQCQRVLQIFGRLS